jgi:hypothetical protein
MLLLRNDRVAAVFLLGSLLGCTEESGTGGAGTGTGGRQTGTGGSHVSTGGSGGAGTGGSQASTGGTGTGTGGSDTGTGNMGSGGAGTPPSTLAGTWEVIESGDTAPLGLITLGKDELVIAFGNSQLSYRAENGLLTVSYQEGATKTPVAATRQAKALDTGALALELGGTWSFTASDGSGEACNAQVDPGSFTASCSGVTPPDPVPPATGTITGSRIETRSSIFGELGGLWTVTTENGHCTAELVDNEFMSTCEGEPGGTEHGIHGSVEIVFNGDIASGHASDAIEFSAHRIQ